MSKFLVSAFLKHFVKLWTCANICGFIKLMVVTGLAVVESISNSLSSWSLNLLILPDYPLPSSSSLCTEIQDMNASLGIEGSWRLTYEEIILTPLAKIKLVMHSAVFRFSFSGILLSSPYTSVALCINVYHCFNAEAHWNNTHSYYQWKLCLGSE